MNNSHTNIRNNVASLVAAAKAVAQINAQLAAEGKILQSNSDPGGYSKKDKKVRNVRKDLFQAEVEINHLPQKVRNLLTKGYIQEQIQWKSKAALCTKGKYIPPQENGTCTDEKPLYICVQSVDQHAVQAAVQQIKKFICEHAGSGPAISSGTSPNNTARTQNISQTPVIRDKVYINLDHAPPSFRLVERVLGTSGDNIAYIQNETGVSVSLQGQHISTGLTNEPVHLLLEHTDPIAIQNARSLSLSLVGTLQQDYILWQQEQSVLQQSQIIYTLSQPCFQGSSSGNTSCQYPTLAMFYGIENRAEQTVVQREQQSAPSLTQSHVSAKRPSRFDTQQVTGTNTSGDDVLTKRPKLANPPYPR